MKREIFKYELLVGVLVAVLCCLFFVVLQFRSDETQTFSRLAAETDAVMRGTEMAGTDYLNALNTGDRVTWIDSEGDVLFDSEVDAETMENHLDRAEISDAQSTGQGQSVRYSETLLKRNLYYALRLSDGSVVRVSCTQSSVAALLLALVWPVLGVLALAAILCLLLAFRLSRRIVAPINRIDLDHPAAKDTYPELHPLVERIRTQNRTIRGQMEELGRQRREFDALTENMGEGFLLLDNHLHILSGNPAARRLLGDGEKAEILRRDSTFPALCDAAESALTGTKSESIQEIDSRSWQISANPIVADGQVAGAAVLLTDVTEREQRERLRREFSANVSHELKTPLTSISGFAELMEAGLVAPEKMTEFASDIHRETQHLIGLVNDIIRLSRLDEGGIYQKESVDLCRLCREVLEILQPVALEKNITISFNGDTAEIFGVPEILHDLVYNLCENSVKYNRSGGCVFVDVETEDGHVRLTVQDTGIGIPPADQERVFERFYRVDKSHSKTSGGTGLGLSIVKHAAQYHNASVTLKSEPGVGTAISVLF